CIRWARDTSNSTVRMLASRISWVTAEYTPAVTTTRTMAATSPIFMRCMPGSSARLGGWVGDGFDVCPRGLKSARAVQQEQASDSGEQSGLSAALQQESIIPPVQAGGNARQVGRGGGRKLTTNVPGRTCRTSRSGGADAEDEDLATTARHDWVRGPFAEDDRPTGAATDARTGPTRRQARQCRSVLESLPGWPPVPVSDARHQPHRGAAGADPGTGDGRGAPLHGAAVPASGPRRRDHGLRRSHPAGWQDGGCALHEPAARLGVGHRIVPELRLTFGRAESLPRGPASRPVAQRGSCFI